MDESIPTPKRKYNIKSPTERIYNGVGFVYKDLLKLYKKLKKEVELNTKKGQTPSKDDIVRLTKLAGTIGYMAQVHGGLAKAYDYEKRLADLEVKLEMDKLKKHPNWGK